MKQVLDLGCGTAKVEGAVGLDNVEIEGVDVVHNLLAFPYPFHEAFFDVIYLRHVIEHFNIEDIEKIFSECFRILNNHGYLEVRVPHAFSIAAFTDPTHKKFFTFGSGQFWDRNNPKSYYQETKARWLLVNTSCRVTWFDWKLYRLRKIDRWMSDWVENRINNALKNKSNPSLADRIVKCGSYQFVEIAWTFQKVS